MWKNYKKDLTRLEPWSNGWQLQFNTDKCDVMRISKKNDSLKALTIIYVVIIEKMILEFTLLWTCGGACK